MLELVAKRSTCARRRVGAIVTDERGRVLATGYNGVPSGFDHCTETPCAGTQDAAGDTRNCLAVHAEQNALLQLEGAAPQAHTIYTSCSPCFVCAKLIANTRIRRVVFTEAYADATGAAVLMTKGIEVVHKSR